jgi:hypothetical protein
LVEALLYHGWSVWWDRAILPGKTWDQAIERELAAARCVIVLWSLNSIQSDWVRIEAEEAKKRGVLVPALLDDVNIPLEFNRLQAANLVEWLGVLPSASFDELARGVSEVLSRPASPAQAAVSGTSAASLEAQQIEGTEGLRRAGEEHVGTKSGDGSKAERAAPKMALGLVVLTGTIALALVAAITWYFAAGHPLIPHPDTNGQSGKTEQGPTDKHFGNERPGSTPTQESEVVDKRPSTAKGPQSLIPHSEAVNFNGTWTADLRYKLWDPDKTYRERFQFEILGDEVVGSASLMGVPRVISDGTVHGRSISFITKYPLSEGMQENRYRGSISGDQIQFTYQDPSDGALIGFSAARVKP